jgi:hypothetical protein
MNKIKLNNLFGIIASAMVMCSCEDVIELELKNSSPRLVVESLITDDGQPVTVKLSKSADFYSQSEMPIVSGALVIVTDNNQITDTLIESEKGIYRSSQIKGIPGHSYQLTIAAENLKVTAISEMPQKLYLDSLDYEWGENPHNEGYMVNMWFNDPVGISNYYRIELEKNGEPFKDKESGNELILQTDKIWDGKTVHIPVKQGGGFFEIGDTVTVNFANLNQSTYDYYFTLKAALATGSSPMAIGKSMMQGSAAPANPNNTFSEDVLGYFGAASVSSKTIIIK